MVHLDHLSITLSVVVSAVAVITCIMSVIRFYIQSLTASIHSRLSMMEKAAEQHNADLHELHQVVLRMSTTHNLHSTTGSGRD